MKLVLVLACLLCLKYQTAAENQIDQDDFTLISEMFEHRAQQSSVHQHCADCKCGQAVNERIIGNDEVLEGMYPWAVRVQFSNDNETITCGGSIINNLYVLTAAHCVPSGATNITIFLNLEKGSDPTDSALEIEAKSVIVHEEYTPDALINDLALIKLSHKMDISNISPVCLSKMETNYERKTATAIGWGFTTSDGPPSDVPLRTFLPVLSKEDCDLEYDTLPELMLCAGTDDGGRRYCFGDSGGPIQIKDARTGAHVQIGLSTWVARECGRSIGYSVFTNLAHYYDWIRINTVDACYCSEPKKHNVQEIFFNLLRG